MMHPELGGGINVVYFQVVPHECYFKHSLGLILFTVHVSSCQTPQTLDFRFLTLSPLSL